MFRVVEILAAAFLRRSRELCSETAGNAATLLGVAALPVMLATGAAVDYSRASHASARLQEAADSAALAIATAKTAPDAATATARGIVESIALGGGLTNVNATATFNADKSVTVKATADVSTTLMAMVQPSVSIARSGTAGMGAGSGASTGPSACILTLNMSGPAYMQDSSSKVNASCGVQSNSASSNGIRMSAGAALTSKSTCVVGNTSLDVRVTFSPAPSVGCAPLPDPLASLPAPPNAANACDRTGVHIPERTTVSFTPGVYYGGINLENGVTATFAPGIYILRDGSFITGSGAKVSGDQVMFFLTGAKAAIVQDAHGTMQFTAPSTCAYKGVVIYQDRASSPDGSIFGSGAGNKFQGAIYMPKGYLHIDSGGTTTMSDWTVLVVGSLFVDASVNLLLTSNYTTSTTPLPDALAGGAGSGVARLMN